MCVCAVMTECDFHPQLDAYHDRELNAEARQRFEEHLKECPTCSRELSAMRAISARIESALPHDIDATESSRIHAVVDRVADEQPESLPLLRTAGLLSALAASVLIIGGVWLM